MPTLPNILAFSFKFKLPIMFTLLLTLRLASTFILEPTAKFPCTSIFELESWEPSIISLF